MVIDSLAKGIGYAMPRVCQGAYRRTETTGEHERVRNVTTTGAPLSITYRKAV